MGLSRGLPPNLSLLICLSMCGSPCPHRHPKALSEEPLEVVGVAESAFRPYREKFPVRLLYAIANGRKADSEDGIQHTFVSQLTEPEVEEAA